MAGSAKREALSLESSRELFREYARTKDLEVRERLVLAHMGLAKYLAGKFAYRGEPVEDLIQVAQVGLLQAIDRYDPARGVAFSTYATATIVGEIKRYFRDKTWAIHVPRRLRELNNSLMRAVDRLSASLGRSPTIGEIAEDSGVPFEDILEALEVGRAYNPASLEADIGGDGHEDGASLSDYIGAEDPELRRTDDRHTIEEALASLPDRERTIVRMRYYEERSQVEIAKHLGISQMHVSRIQREALRRLGAKLGA